MSRKHNSPPPRSAAKRGPIPTRADGARLRSALALASAPALSVFALAFVAITLLGMLSPMYAELNPELGPLREASPRQIAQFGSASLVWIAGGCAVFVALLASLAIASWTILLLGSYRRRGFTVLGIAIVLAGWAAGYRSFSAAWHDQVSDLGWTTLPIDYLTNMWNMLTAATVAALAVASGVIIFSLRSKVAACPQAAAARLKWLLSSGAVALVFGVFTINSLYQLPTTLVARTTPAERAAIEAALGGLLSAKHAADVADGEPRDEEATDSRQALWQYWLSSRLEPEVPPTVVSAIASELANGTSAPIHQPALDSIARELLPRSPPKRSAPQMSSSMERLASHTASFWGVVFTATLVLVYLPAAACIAAAKNRDGQPSYREGLLGLFSLDSSSGILDPLLRILVALSPLLAGVFPELAGAIQALLTSSTA